MRQQKTRNKVEHGIDGGTYSLQPGGPPPSHVHYGPVLFCLCGHATGHGNDTWEDAGAALDRHLEEVKKPRRAVQRKRPRSS
jgi:hypothetical protein